MSCNNSNSTNKSNPINNLNSKNNSINSTSIHNYNSKDDQILRWAKFIRENPDKWKAIHTKFINAQFEKSREFYKRLAKTPNGKEKIRKIFNIQNTEFEF